MTAQDIPGNLRYTTEHEWISRDGEKATVGITAFAVGALGDVVFVLLPDVGEQVQAGLPCGELESTKAVSDLFAPVSGDVNEANGELGANPELVNSDPYGGGWMIKVGLTDPSQIDGLLDATAYDALIAAG